MTTVIKQNPFQSRVSISTKKLKDQYAQVGVIGFNDFVNLPKSKITGLNKFVSHDADWNSLHPDPSMKELYVQRLKEDEITESSLSEEPIYPPKDEWVALDDLLLDLDGMQRNQFQDARTWRATFERADKFDFTRAKISVAKLDCPGNKYDGRYFVWDGGGTCCSAALRGIKELPVSVIVKAHSRKKIGEMFHELAESTNSVSGEDKFQYRLVCGDEYAELQHKIMMATHTTPIRNHRDGSYTNIRITALKKLIDGKFTRSEKTISGDPASYLNDKDKFRFRRCQNIVEVLQVIKDIYPDALSISPSFMKGLTIAYATFSNIWTARTITRMLQDYKNGLVEIKGKELDQECSVGVIDWSTQDKLQKCLGLQDMTESHRMYAVYIFAKLWNNWQRSNRQEAKIQEDWIKAMRNVKSDQYWYDPNKDYTDHHLKVKQVDLS